MLLEFRFLINVRITISRSGLEQDVCKETNVTNGLLMLKISPCCGCVVPVSFPSSQCHQEEQSQPISPSQHVPPLPDR